jgi:hypothetical protein
MLKLMRAHAGTCAGSCDAPSAGGYGPSAFFIYNANSPVTADLAISPLPPVPGAATTLTATIRAATPPYAPIPGAMATIYPNVGEGQVTTEGGYAYNGATDANGQFSVVAHYIKDGQYFPSVGTSVNQPAGAPIFPLLNTHYITSNNCFNIICRRTVSSASLHGPGTILHDAA